MPYLFNQHEINAIKNDLRIFLTKVSGTSDKLNYFTTRTAELEIAGSIEIEYFFEQMDIIAEVENAVIQQLEMAEKKELSIQLHLAPASLVVTTDRLFFQQIFFRLLSALLALIEKKSIVGVYVMDSDGKCIVEVIHRPEAAPVAVPDDYFKKYRITNSLQPVQADTLLKVYKRMMDEMGGELLYAFEKGKANYFRLKFDMV